MANFEIDEDQAALIRELRKLETSDPVHANVYNALFEKLINNDAFLERLANKMIEKSMLCHVLDSVNAQQVLAADVGPKITAITNELKENVSVLNTKKAEKQWEYIGDSFNDVTFAPNKYSEIYVCAFIDDDNSKMIPFLLPLETIKHGPDNSITNPRFAGASLYNGWALLHYNDGLIRMQSSSAGSTSIYVYGR